MLTKNDELEYWWNVKDTWEDAEAEENEASIHAYWNWLGPIYQNLGGYRLRDFCIQTPHFRFFMQKMRIFGAEMAILRVFQTFLRTTHHQKLLQAQGVSAFFRYFL